MRLGSRKKREGEREGGWGRARRERRDGSASGQMLEVFCPGLILWQALKGITNPRLFLAADTGFIVGRLESSSGLRERLTRREEAARDRGLATPLKRRLLIFLLLLSRSTGLAIN